MNVKYWAALLYVWGGRLVFFLTILFGGAWLLVPVVTKYRIETFLTVIIAGAFGLLFLLFHIYIRASKYLSRVDYAKWSKGVRLKSIAKIKA